MEKQDLTNFLHILLNVKRLEMHFHVKRRGKPVERHGVGCDVAKKSNPFSLESSRYGRIAAQMWSR
jgi:hypothetical protein